MASTTKQTDQAERIAADRRRPLAATGTSGLEEEEAVPHRADVDTAAADFGGRGEHQRRPGARERPAAAAFLPQERPSHVQEREIPARRLGAGPHEDSASEHRLLAGR